jgi:protein-disulfide isomerase
MVLHKKINETDRFLGNTHAQLILVEYGDYECPDCSSAHKHIKKLQQYFGSRMLYVYRNFPLTAIHPKAISAAYVAEAAGLQGKFWTAHDFIFESHNKLCPIQILDHTRKAGADIDKLVKDANSYRVIDKVEADIDSGEKSGVNRTPAFFINGKRYNGSYNYDDFLEVLDFRYNHSS